MPARRRERSVLQIKVEVRRIAEIGARRSPLSEIELPAFARAIMYAATVISSFFSADAGVEFELL